MKKTFFKELENSFNDYVMFEKNGTRYWCYCNPLNEDANKVQRWFEPDYMHWISSDDYKSFVQAPLPKLVELAIREPKDE